MKTIDKRELDKGVRVYHRNLNKYGSCLSESALGETDVLFDDGQELCVSSGQLSSEVEAQTEFNKKSQQEDLARSFIG